MRNVRRLQESANTPQKIRKGSLRMGISYIQYDGTLQGLSQGVARNTLNFIKPLIYIKIITIFAEKRTKV